MADRIKTFIFIGTLCFSVVSLASPLQELRHSLTEDFFASGQRRSPVLYDTVFLSRSERLDRKRLRAFLSAFKDYYYLNEPHFEEVEIRRSGLTSRPRNRSSEFQLQMAGHQLEQALFYGIHEWELLHKMDSDQAREIKASVFRSFATRLRRYVSVALHLHPEQKAVDAEKKRRLAFTVTRTSLIALLSSFLLTRAIDLNQSVSALAVVAATTLVGAGAGFLIGKKKLLSSEYWVRKKLIQKQSQATLKGVWRPVIKKLNQNRCAYLLAQRSETKE